MHKTRSKKPQSRLRLLLLILIMLLTGIVTTLFSSPQARHLLRAQLRSIDPGQLSRNAELGRSRLDNLPYVGGYWPDIYKNIYIDASRGSIANVYQNPLIDMATCAKLFPDFLQCNITAPIDDYYAKKFAAECKAMYPNNPWLQIWCTSAKLSAYYGTTARNECCRNYSRDMQKIIPLLQWGDAQVTVSQQALWITRTPPVLPVGHVLNHIRITTPSGPYPGKTFSYMYDAGWFPRNFYPADPTTQAYYKEHSQWSFPYYPSSTNAQSKATPPQALSPESLPVPRSNP